MKRALLAALFVTAVASQPAAHAQRAFTSGGASAVTCGAYLKAREDRQDMSYIASWVWGYISGYNQWSTYPQINDFPSEGTVVAYFDKHCRENPLETLMQGTVALVADLGGFRPPPRNKR